MKENIFKPFIDDEEFFWKYVDGWIIDNHDTDFIREWIKYTKKAKIEYLKRKVNWSISMGKLSISNQYKKIQELPLSSKGHYLEDRIIIYNRLLVMEDFAAALNQIERNKDNYSGEKIKELIAKEGISERELSRLTNISLRSISGIITGKQNPRLTTLIKIAKVLKVDEEILFNNLHLKSTRRKRK